MTQMIFINLPVSDVQASTAFYEALGAAKNKQFSSEANSNKVISDAISVMLLSHDRWRDFTSKTIPDAKTSAQMLLCLSKESRDACDAAVDAAVKAGGKAGPDPETGSRLHVWTILRRPGRPHLGGRLDGHGKNAKDLNFRHLT